MPEDPRRRSVRMQAGEGGPGRIGRVGSREFRTHLSGCLCFALGVKCFLASGLGVDPFHTMTVGIVQQLDTSYLGIGFVDCIATLALLAAWTVWNHRLPPLSVFVSMALIGYTVDLLNVLGVEQWTRPFMPALLLMLLGLIFEAYGAAMILVSGFGIRVMDFVAITISQRLNWSFFTAKLGLEGAFLGCGWMLGGPVGITTFAFLITVGPFTEPVVRSMGQELGLPRSRSRRTAAK